MPARTYRENLTKLTARSAPPPHKSHIEALRGAPSLPLPLLTRVCPTSADGDVASSSVAYPAANQAGLLSPQVSRVPLRHCAWLPASEPQLRSRVSGAVIECDVPQTEVATSSRSWTPEEDELIIRLVTE